MRRAPAHAGRLRPWERSAFGLVFVLMAAFVVAATLLAGKSGGGRPAASVAAGSPSLTAGPGLGQEVAPAAVGSVEQTATGAVPATIAPSAQLNARLAAALAALPGYHRDRLAVGVIDESSGTEAVLRAGVSFPAAGLADTDLVAALLLERQRAGKPVTAAESGLAAAMMQDGSSASAAALWKRVEPGLAAANATLQLRPAGPGDPGSWTGLKTTTADQLQLLADLYAVRSPVDSAGRDYLLGLMTGAEAIQRWGVSAAAASGTSYAVKDGRLAEAGGWVINSSGIIESDNSELLVVVLSDGNPAEASGMRLVESAARAAAAVITAGT